PCRAPRAGADRVAGAGGPRGRARARPARLIRLRRTESESAADTEAVGAELAATLEPGDVVLVSGDLGAGKTTLIHGACRALGVTDPIASPTFTIRTRYRGRVPVSHLDLYRL